MLVHDRPGCHRDDGFRGWWAVTQCTVGSLGVVVFPPFRCLTITVDQLSGGGPVAHNQWIKVGAVVKAARHIGRTYACGINPNSTGVGGNGRLVDVPNFESGVVRQND